jgi:hypothetical protein
MQWPAIQRWNDLLYPPVLSRIESNLKKSIKSLELGLVGTPQRKRFNFKKTRYVYPMVTLFLFRLQYPLDLDRAPLRWIWRNLLISAKPLLCIGKMLKRVYGYI